MRFDNLGNLKYSSYLGAIDAEINEIAIDYLENVYYFGDEKGDSIGNGGLTTIQYPPNYYTKNRKGKWEGFILTMNTINLPDWTTYFGCNVNDVAEAITISPDNHLYITGNASSQILFDFKDPLPLHPDNWYENTQSPIGDIYISKFLLSHLVNVSEVLSNVQDKYFKIYPTISNNGIYNIEINQLLSLSQLVVFNSIGQEMLRQSINTYSDKITQLDLSHLSTGTYFVSLISPLSTQTEKIILIK